MYYDVNSTGRIHLFIYMVKQYKLINFAATKMV